jgi:hypothetical protein
MTETLTATSKAGIFYSLVAGQPLIPMGPTGALLVFDEILYNVSGLVFMKFRSLRPFSFNFNEMVFSCSFVFGTR